MMGKLEGTWSVSGDKLSVKADKIGGRTIEETKKQLLSMSAANPAAKANADNLDKPTEFTISSDNKTLTAVPDPNVRQTGTLVYKKKA
jgi:hypothetical protein